MAEKAAREGKFELAAQAYEKLVRAQPESPELWSNLGAVRALGGNCSQAFPALDRARSLNRRLFTPWYFSGLCHVAVHRDEQALADLKRAVVLNSRDANAWFLEAQAAGNLDKLEVSFGSVVRGLTLDSKRPEGYYLAGKTALDLAKVCYDRVLAGTRPNAFALRLEGERNAAQAVWALSIHIYKKAAQLAPQYPDVHFSLATAYLESNKYAEAETELQRCLELSPHSTWAKLRLALALAEQGKVLEARAIVDSIDPEQLESVDEVEDYLADTFLLGLPDLAQRVLGQALARFSRDTALDPWQSRLASLSSAGSADTPSLELGRLTRVGLSLRFEVLSNPTKAGFVAGLFNSAREYGEFRTAFLHSDLLTVAKIVSPRLEPLPQGANQLFTLGEILHWLSYRLYEHLGSAYPDSEAAARLAAENLSAAGQQEKALEIYRAMIEKKGRSPELLREVARIYWTQHRWDDALTTLQRLMELDPYDPTVFVNVGRIYSNQQNLDAAEENFRRAMEIEPKMFEAHLGLGETLRRKGNDQSALREFNIASEIEPENPRPHYALSQLYRRLGRKELAGREMSTFQRIQARAAPEKIRKARQLVPLD